MSEQLQEKIIELIDDYLVHGLKIDVDIDLNPIERGLGEIAYQIDRLSSIGPDIGSSISELCDVRTNDADWNHTPPDGVFVHENDGTEVYEHPISAIAEALFEIARKGTADEREMKKKKS